MELNEKGNEIRNILILMCVLVFILIVGSYGRSARDNNPLKEPCLILLDEAREKCDWTIEVDAWSWECEGGSIRSGEDVYTKMMKRNDTGLFCIEKYFADFEAFLTYTCEMKDGKLVKQDDLKIDGVRCVEFERTHFNG